VIWIRSNNQKWSYFKFVRASFVCLFSNLIIGKEKSRPTYMLYLLFWFILLTIAVFRAMNWVWKDLRIGSHNDDDICNIILTMISKVKETMTIWTKLNLFERENNKSGFIFFICSSLLYNHWSLKAYLISSIKMKYVEALEKTIVLLFQSEWCIILFSDDSMIAGMKLTLNCCQTE
jgi:hypothetical protein